MSRGGPAAELALPDSKVGNEQPNMKTKTSRLLHSAAGLMACCILIALRSQDLQSGQPLDPAAMQWPRFFQGNGLEFAVYQPQISCWPSNQIQGRFATAVRQAGTSNETYGVVLFQARTEIDKVNRLVTLEDFQLRKLDFPTAPQPMRDEYRIVIQERLPQAAKTIPLDHLEAVFVVSAEVAKAKLQPVKNDPPWVLYATQPSILILVDGPRSRPRSDARAGARRAPSRPESWNNREPARRL